MKNVIYQIRNLLDEKIYIGSSQCSKKRKREHFYNLRKNNHHCNHLQHAYNLYGEENFVFEIIDQTNDPYNLAACEQHWIDSYDFDTQLYNSCPLAYSPLGIKHTEETRKKISEGNKGKKRSLETRDKISKAHMGKKKSRESVRKSANSKRGVKHTKKTRKKISEAMSGENHPFWGKKFPKSHRENISQNQPSRKPVVQICSISNNILAVFGCIADAAKITETNRLLISRVCNKKPCGQTDQYIHKTAGGFIWKFADEIEGENDR